MRVRDLTLTCLVKIMIIPRPEIKDVQSDSDAIDASEITGCGHLAFPKPSVTGECDKPTPV